MATRAVSSQITKPNGTAWPGAKVKFRPVYDTYTISPDATYPIQTVVAEADATGALSVTLVSGTSTPYEVTMPDGEVFRINVPTGSSTTLEALRLAYDITGPVAPANLQAMITTAVQANSATISDPELVALSALVSATDRLPYFTGSGAASLATFTAFARTLVDDASASAARATLGVPDFSSFAVTLLDDLDAAAMRTTLGVFASTEPELAALAGLASATDTLPYFTGSGTAALATFTSFARQLLDDTTNTAMRTTLGLVAGGSGDIWMEKAGDTATGAVLSSGTGGVGYAAGAGGTVTQLTSKATGVTLNTICGQITTNSAALAASAEVAFVVTNSRVAATDVVVVCIQSGAVAPADYTIHIGAVAAGNFTITLGNMGTVSRSDTLVINFAIIKATAS